MILLLIPIKKSFCPLNSRLMRYIMVGYKEIILTIRSFIFFKESKQ
jgi:hypothetical protein